MPVLKSESLQDRRILGDEGFVALTVVIEPSTRTIVRPVHLSTRGFSDDPGAFDEVLTLVEKELKRALAQLGRGIGGPWRAEEKSAALAAWILLASPAPRDG